MFLFETKFCHELHNLFSSRKDRIATFEGCFAEESLENSRFVVTLRLPFAIRHRDLVKVSEERVHPVEGLLVALCSSL